MQLPTLVSLPFTRILSLALNISIIVEALYARNKNPIISLMALEGIKALAESLPIIVLDPSSLNARSKAQYGAWLCRLCLGSISMALHHKLCYTLGGSYNMPHAETHTIILPHALAYNAPYIPEVIKQLAAVLPRSKGDAIRGLTVLLTKLGVKRGLADFGFREEDINEATKLALSNPYWNPRSVEEAPVRELIRRAVIGEQAKADF